MASELINKVISQYLYGSDARPTEKSDGDLIRDNNARGTVGGDLEDFMETGGGGGT